MSMLTPIIQSEPVVGWGDCLHFARFGHRRFGLLRQTRMWRDALARDRVLERQDPEQQNSDFFRNPCMLQRLRSLSMMMYAAFICLL
jgi:hypothetical protein